MKLAIKKAVKGLNQFDLSSTHLTTMDFGLIQPTYFCECVPNDKFHIEAKSFARLAPLAVPVFGTINCYSRCFFVPMRALWTGWKDWISRSSDSSVASTLPTINNFTFCSWFEDSANGLTNYLGEFSSIDLVDFAYDFAVSSSTGFTKVYTFTPKGRWLYKIFLSLGYSINFVTGSDFSNGNAVVDSSSFSALPILAFLRVMYDYVYPSEYVQQLSLGSLFENRSNITSSNLISALLDLTVAPYRQDYFTSAWQNINQKGTSDNVNLAINDPQTNKNVTSSSSGIVADVTNGLSAMGQRILNNLNDFMQRNNIAGSRYYEQMLARFGIKSPMVDPDRAIYISSFKDEVRIQDVTATATTDFTVLGEQGAKGLQNIDQNVHSIMFESNESYGYFIVLSHVMPEIGYYQGIKRHVVHTDVFDFYTPEFDNIGLQAIRNDELFRDFKNTRDYSNAQLFGGKGSSRWAFAPRYSEYKKQDDYLTGDYRVPSANVGLDAYHCMRVLPTPSQNHPLSLSADFMLVKQHDYDRIFQQPAQANPWISLISSPALHYDNNYQVDVPAGQFDYIGFNGKVCIFYTSESTPRYFVLYYNNANHTWSIDWLTSLSNIHAGTHTPLYIAQNEMPHVVYSESAYPLSSLKPVALESGYSDNSNTQFIVKLCNYYFWVDFVTANNVPKSLTSFIAGTSSNSWTIPMTSKDAFTELYLEYFDHFYSMFKYKVTASRSMLSISESMPINDGGSLESVDYGGFNFTT